MVNNIKNCDAIPYTGMGLTKKQIQFFHKPRTMEEIALDLFNGDYWEANHFQNKFIGNDVLHLTEKPVIMTTDILVYKCFIELVKY